jgi:cyclophilin family peptidyl-prolyl cis-trans isomerase
MKRLLAAGALVLAGLVPAAAQQANDPQNTVFLDTKDGRITIRLRPDLAPKHVEQIKALTKRGFYNGVVFHRVIDGFMAQTGDPTGTGGGGSELPNVVAEFNAESFQRGVVGAARTQDPNTFNSQFFIVFADASFLDGQYTVFGKVVSGMEFVDNIAKGEPPPAPDKIISAKIEYK